ncbi:2-amino-4-hydroxy-6-hydroxymethyldihydropteridine diphosphokinase [Thalassospiraceae bacterium LMO-SO8]|nr:2-amino-4-hydroxy-6-hydroxymethyldihydropteridine diphosphokinase [Alphaproteobacteria bacterium LMO-S08]WND75685.1 2-amino-4-hydroxy-6-hydroxymethyldihydropteridine diphosphokinase [Thalassospiraceae bacterium LMO-SO8]
MSGPIVIGVGGNLPTAEFGPPRATCGAALQVLSQHPGVAITAHAGWYETAPVPVSDQPWFVNGAVAVATDLPPDALMAALLDIETRFGRRRGERNAARILDLDLLTFGDRVLTGDLEVPHPRLHARAFALLPIRDVAPGWRHPVLGRTIEALCAELPADQEIRPLADAGGYLGTEWQAPE